MSSGNSYIRPVPVGLPVLVRLFILALCLTATIVQAGTAYDLQLLSLSQAELVEACESPPMPRLTAIRTLRLRGDSVTG